MAPFVQLTDKKRPLQKTIASDALHKLGDSNVKKHGNYIVKLNVFRKKKILSWTLQLTKMLLLMFHFRPCHRDKHNLTQFHLAMCTFCTSIVSTPSGSHALSFAELTSISEIMANIRAGACLTISYGMNRLNNRVSLGNTNTKNSMCVIFTTLWI